jgi:hypothetical protein
MFTVKPDPVINIPEHALKINVFSIVLEVSTWHVGCDCKSAALGFAH